MGSIRYVENRQQLKSAIKEKCEEIVITDGKLGTQVRIVKAAPKATVAVAVTAAGAAVVMWWNPIGWLGMGVVLGYAAINAPLAAAIMFLTVVLGAAVLYALYRDYEAEFEFDYSVKPPKGHLILRLKHWKSAGE